jgi:hypothetical protein
MMRPIHRTFVRLGITLAIAAILASLVPTFVDRRAYVAAVDNYVKNPTLENGVALSREHAKNRRITALTRLGVGCLLFVALNVSWAVVSRRQNIATVQERK